MDQMITAARQELLSLRREKLPKVLLLVFMSMVIASGFIGWLTNSTVSNVWAETRKAGLTHAPNPFSHVSALFYVRNTVIYMVLIGALMAIVVGVTSMLRDRKAQTFDLVLSRAVTARTYLFGKLLGIALWLSIILAAVASLTWVSVALVTRQLLGISDSTRLFGFFGLSLLFLLIFVLLGMAAGAYARRESSALLVPISVWSIVTFVLPQLGTAAHPVSLLNPVPAPAVHGGSFDTLNMIVGPLSVTEQFKTAGSLLLNDPNATGAYSNSAATLIIALALGLGGVMTINRDRLRGMLHE